jgi:hypothetical protein
MSLAETFEPREWQEQIIGNPKKGIPEDKTKYKVVVAHRKAGKTVLALMYLFMLAYRCKDAVEGAPRVPRFTYIAPTYAQAKDIACDLLKDIIPPSMLLKKPNETQLEVRLSNRVILNLKGADNEDSLRGPGLYFALLDEYAFMKPHIWQQIIQPELASTGGGAMFIGTPDGRNHFYEVFANGRDGVKDWKSWLLPATKPTVNFEPETPRGPQLLSPGFLESVKTEGTEKFYEQEYECEFAENAGMVFDRIDENVIDEWRDFPEQGHRYRIGFDPAFREDFSAFVVLDMTDWKIKYVYRTNKTDIEMILDKAELMFNTWTTSAGRPDIIMDSTGMGDLLFDKLSTKGYSITPVKFTSAGNKQTMVRNLATRLSKDEIKIPKVDWLIDEFKDYRYRRMDSGRYKYGAPQGKHDDGVTAVMLATHDLPPMKAVLRARLNQYTEGKFNKYTGIAM